MHRREFLAVTSMLGLTSLTPGIVAATPGLPALPTRRRVSGEGASGWRVVEGVAKWNPRETALVICDMWDLHHCKNATERVGELAPRMNDFVKRARSTGVLIIHAPSSCLAPYEGTAARRRAKEAPQAANLPSDIAKWCDRIPAEEAGKYPIDQSDGGCDTEDEPQKAWAAHLTSLGRNPRLPLAAANRCARDPGRGCSQRFRGGNLESHGVAQHQERPGLGGPHQHVRPGSTLWAPADGQERSERPVGTRSHRHHVQSEVMAPRRSLHRYGSHRGAHREVCVPYNDECLVARRAGVSIQRGYPKVVRFLRGRIDRRFTRIRRIAKSGHTVWH
jgi:hypothetical protein